MSIQKLYTSLSKTAVSSTYVGDQGRIWYDSVAGFRISNGVTPGGLPAVIAVTNANIGNLVITGDTISTLNTNEDLTLASNGTGNVRVNGAFITETTSGRTIIETLQNGTMNFYIPTIDYDSAIDIIGSADGSIVTPQNTGVLLHLTGQDSLPARIYNDSSNNYAAFIGRRYNGSPSAPTQVLAGNIIARYGATPYGSSGWPSISTARIDFVSSEDQTSTNKGTSIEFYTTQPGTSSTVNSGSIDYRGFSGNSFIFTTDNTTQTTAGIPMTYRGNLSATKVATLGADGTLDSSQIPGSLIGGVQYKGGWDANANSPTLANGSGTAGWEYSITTTGTRNLGGGNQTYQAGGFVIYNGSIWTYIAPVSNFTSLTAGTHLSVDTPVGAINLTTDATPTFTASTIVSRDSSGNFVANVITATLTGTATSATTAGTVTGNIQTAITQVGTLVSLGVTGNITAGNVSAASGTISATNGVFTNINAYQTFANANVSSLQNQITSANTNINAYQTFANANVAGLQNQITSANTNISTNATNITTLFSNAGTQQTQINSLATNANANTASYLSNGISTRIVTTGNITANTLTANTFIIGSGGIRTVSGGTPTVTLNFGTDSIIHVYQPAGTVTFQYGTLVAGSSIRCLINFATHRNIVTGVSASNNINLAGKTNVGGAGNAANATDNTLAQLLYNCVDGTAANTYCTISYT